MQELIRKQAGRGLLNPGPTRLPWLVRLLERTKLPSRIRTHLICVGIRPEHVKTQYPKPTRNLSIYLNLRIVDIHCSSLTYASLARSFPDY